VFVQEWDVGWGERETFVKEFCALGGQVTQVGVSFFNPDHPDADVKLVPRNVDGVAVFAPSLLGPAAFLTGLAHSLHDPARQMVVGPSVVDDPDLMRATRRALTGVVASSELPDAGRSPVMRAYQRAMAQTFPGIPADSARSAIVLGYRNAVEFLARGLQRAGGDPTRLPAALATLHTNLTGAPMHLDANRQVVGTTTIVKIGPPPKAQSDPGLIPLATIPNVDESTGGLVAPSVQTKFGPVACRRATPPPWSR
jgi:hypothetical protein